MQQPAVEWLVQPQRRRVVQLAWIAAMFLSLGSAARAQPADAAADQEPSTAAETPGDSDEAAQAPADGVAKDAGEVFEALRSADLATAAEKSGALLVQYGLPAMFAIVVVVVAFFVAAFVARLCSAPIRVRVDETLGRFVRKFVFYAIMVCALLGVLQYFGIGIASFAAVIAAIGFAIGLAFQGTLSNFSAGIMLLVFRPFKVGDVVNAAGIFAKVHEIDLFTTAFDTFDNRRIVVPNSSITGTTIENISFHPQRRVDINVGVEYAADLEKTRETLAAAVESLREFLIEGEDRGYQIVMGDLGDSAVAWTVRFWTTAGDFWTVKEKLTAAIKNHLDRAGIGIPFPQMDVHLHQNGPPAEPAQHSPVAT